MLVFGGLYMEPHQPAGVYGQVHPQESHPRNPNKYHAWMSQEVSKWLVSGL